MPARVAGDTVVGRWPELAGWLALAVLLVLLVPLFLCMPLTVDATFYDICARQILRGGALEKDFLFLPPPGMPWAIAAARAALGGSSVALRAADLAVVTAIIGLLAGWLRARGLPRAAVVWFAAALAAFYLTASEWVQVQPDTWMLLPALAALHLRRRQVARLTSRAAPPAGLAGRAALEGACWAGACLFKPFVLIPALACWLVSALLIRQGSRRWGRALAADLVGLLAGGLLVGATWQAWLLASGSWSHYWHNFFEYRADYYARASAWQDRLLLVFTWIMPWTLIHLAGLLAAVLTLLLGLNPGPRSKPPVPADARPAGALLAALYLGWLVQANYIQSQTAYQVLPTVFLGIALLAGYVGALPVRRIAWVGLFGAAIIAALCEPAVRPERLRLWGRCWREGSSAELRNGLTLDAGYFWSPDWVELERVADFLRAQGAGDGEVTCYAASTTHLYTELGLRPSTPYLYPSVYVALFPNHRAVITQAIRDSAQRFIVTDTRELGPPPDPGDEKAYAYPVSEPVVFEAGRYHVHRPRATGDP